MQHRSPPVDATITGGWIGWDEAAAIVGCSSRTLEYHVAWGRVRRRASRGSRPVLDAASVEEFAKVHAEAGAGRRARRRKPPSRVVVPEGWIDATGAADRLGLSPGRVGQLGQSGVLPRLRAGRRYFYDPDYVAVLVEHRAGWGSAERASQFAGVSKTTILRAARSGEIVMRQAPRAVPALWEESVRRWASERRERTPSPTTKPRPSTTSPDDGHVWVDRAAAALALELSKSRVSQLTNQGHIPHVRAGRRVWYRRDHVERLASAREFDRVQRGLVRESRGSARKS